MGFVGYICEDRRRMGVDKRQKHNVAEDKMKMSVSKVQSDHVSREVNYSI